VFLAVRREGRVDGLGQVRVELHLVEERRHARGRHDVLEVLRRPVRDTDRPDLLRRVPAGSRDLEERRALRDGGADRSSIAAQVSTRQSAHEIFEPQSDWMPAGSGRPAGKDGVCRRKTSR
jgi:hypothetical protein